MPDVDEAQLLIDLIDEVGVAKWNGQALVSLDWNDLDSWVAATGSTLTPGEIFAVKHLSLVYVKQYYDSIDPACMAPHLTAPHNRTVIQSKMKSLFAMLRGNKNV